jgi:hypothetical protein
MYGMGVREFDLIETIVDLLRRIDEGRKIVKETQHISDSFWRVHANRERADQVIQELQLAPIPSDETARNQAQAELDRQVVARQRLRDESHDLWRQLTETVAFTGPFSNDVSLLLERLPLEPKWDLYRRALGKLDVRQRSSWTDPPENSALDTLEMRLREMLDLATPTQRKQVRRVDPFPTPDGALWKDVTIAFISDHRVQITVLGVTEPRSYADMGFEDRRGGGGKPDLAWVCLRSLAELAGVIERRVHFEKTGWKKIEKKVQTLRGRLKELFGIQDDPLPFRERRAYEAQFKVILAKSIEH